VRRRVGWAYTGALLGGAVSIAANVAHSYVPPSGVPVGWHPHGGAVIGAVFWPVALFVAIEIIARTNWPAGKRWVALRFGGLVPVALVAAIVSYRHMSGLLAFYGEDSLTVLIGPCAVDGLMIMAVGALLASAPPVDGYCASPMAEGQADELVDEDTPSDPWSYSEPAPVSEPPTVPLPPAPRPARTRKPTATTTAGQIAKVRARYPDADAASIAAKVGISTRTVRRHLAATRPINGSAVPDLIDTEQ